MSAKVNLLQCTPSNKRLSVFALADMSMALDNIVPESFDWKHTDEGSE